MKVRDLISVQEEYKRLERIVENLENVIKKIEEREQDKGSMVVNGNLFTVSSGWAFNINGAHINNETLDYLEDDFLEFLNKKLKKIYKKMDRLEIDIDNSEDIF